MAVPAPLLLAEVPVPDPEALLATLAAEARQRHDVATGVDDIISLCETAIAKLKEAAATLLQEPGDTAETIYGDVFELAPPGLDSPLLGTAARLVDALFNGSGPLAGAIAVAGDLVHDTFSYSAPEGGPLQSARRELGYLIHVPHVNAFNLFTAYADTLGVPPGDGTRQLWSTTHEQARVRATEAMAWLNDAVESSLAADVALGLCQGEWPERLPPRERMAAAELMLQQTISQVDAARMVLGAMRDRLVELEQIVINATGQAPPPP